MSVPPGWYTDPTDNRQLHWWDGIRWTQHAHLSDTGYHPGNVAMPFQMSQVVVQPASNSLATTGLVLGILGVVIEWGGLLTLTAGVSR